MRAWGNNTDRVLAYLQEEGPCTSMQMQRALGIHRNILVQILKRCRQVAERGPSAGQRRIHIVGWTREVEGAKNHLRAIYAYGDGKDARSPGAKCPNLVNREWRARQAPTLQSVWRS